MNSEIKTIRGVKVPALGLGTYDLRGKECESVVESALKKTGYRHIDTAEMYANEAAIGNVLKSTSISRDELFITTKIWPSSYPKNKFFSAVEHSLKLLHLPQVDLLLLHWPRNRQTNIEATEYLLQCHEMGYAKNIGVSNFNLAELKQAQKQAPIFCNQIKYHPFKKHPDLVAYMQEQDLLITAYSPLETGNITNNSVLTEVGRKYNKTASQVALRWVVQQTNAAAIPKAASKQHQMENLDIFDFTLDNEDLKRLGKS